MPLLLSLVHAFINFFGITKPTPAQERRAAFFIGGLMLVVVLATFAVFLAFLRIRGA